jgi:hypothetical protein
MLRMVWQTGTQLNGSSQAMREGTFLTRRATLGSLAASPLLVIAKHVAATLTDEAHLLALDQDFHVVAARLDYAIAAGIDFDDRLVDQLGRLSAEIALTQASTMEGLFVKARAACWARLGDLDDFDDMTIDGRMALSIVRDLIRLYDPRLERPGALKQLVHEIEKATDDAPSPLPEHQQMHQPGT